MKISKLNQRQQENMVDFITFFILGIVSLLFSMCFYFSETFYQRTIVLVGFLLFLIIGYILNRLETWISNINKNRGNYLDEKKSVEKMV